MNRAQRKTANACSGPNCPKQNNSREEKIKQAFTISSGMRKQANASLCCLSERYRCGLAGLLKLVEQLVTSGRISLYVFEVLIDRVEAQRSRNVLSMEEIADLERAKTSPVRQNK